MVISLDEVKIIVKNLSDRDLNNPEGAGVDLRMGEVHKIIGGKAFIEADTMDSQGRRSGFDTEAIYKYDDKSDEQEILTIKPGDYYLVKTIETVDIPLDVIADFRMRSTLFRAGLNLLSNIGAPGYKGELVFGLVNLGQHPVDIQLGARIANVVFYRMESKGTAYRGQNQNGRVTAAGEEQQV